MDYDYIVVMKRRLILHAIFQFVENADVIITRETSVDGVYKAHFRNTLIYSLKQMLPAILNVAIFT